jgi:hypothetical protein
MSKRKAGFNLSGSARKRGRAEPANNKENIAPANSEAELMKLGLVTKLPEAKEGTILNDFIRMKSHWCWHRLCGLPADSMSPEAKVLWESIKVLHSNQLASAQLMLATHNRGLSYNLFHEQLFILLQ